MQVEILTRPAAAVAKLTLANNEKVICEVGAMIAMTSGLTVETSSKTRGGGGVLKGLKRMFSGENFFLNHFTSHADNEQLIIGPTLLGDVVHHRLRGGAMIVQGSSWLGSSPDINIDATWQGLMRGVFGGEGLFWVKCTGSGDLLMNSFGAIYEIDVDGEYIVDTGHIVAFEDTLTFKLTKAGVSWIGSFLGGEGLVCKFSGKGKLYAQTHNPPSFGKMLGAKLKPR